METSRHSLVRYNVPGTAWYYPVQCYHEIRIFFVDVMNDEDDFIPTPYST
jgi:hypothetical protein